MKSILDFNKEISYVGKQTKTETYQSSLKDNYIFFIEIKSRCSV